MKPSNIGNVNSQTQQASIIFYLLSHTLNLQLLTLIDQQQWRYLDREGVCIRFVFLDRTSLTSSNTGSGTKCNLPFLSDY